MSLGGSLKAMQSLRGGLLGLNPDLQEKGKRLQEKLNQIPSAELEKELQKQIFEKFSACLAAIPAFYLDLNKYQRGRDTVPAIWKQGSTILYEYTKDALSNNYQIAGKSPALNIQNQPPVLIIPSLINRHYILDLEENNSFVKYLAGRGIDTYLAAWGEPDKNELDFSLDDYITRICRMIDIVHQKTGKKIVLTGYCMGGLLALASALKQQDKLQAVAFLATPWDFHAKDFPRFILDGNNLEYVQSFIGSYNKVPASFIQAVFYYLHAHLIGQKFEMYPLTDEQSYQKKGFLAVENWINDGISMTKAAAMESFIDWVHNNNVANLQWITGGIKVNPKKISHLPAFFAIPKKDSIVPPACAFGLTEYFQNCKIIKPNAGHIGMVVGQRAQHQTWEPFVNWLGGIED